MGGVRRILKTRAGKQGFKKPTFFRFFKNLKNLESLHLGFLIIFLIN